MNTALARAVPHPEPEDERDVAIASPTDPRVEYIETGQSGLRSCRCPSLGVILGLGFSEGAEDGFSGWRIKILHAVGCRERITPDTRPVERRRVGVIPCPKCGNVAFSLVPEGRRCTGPTGRACGHVWLPRPVLVGRKEG